MYYSMTTYSSSILLLPGIFYSLSVFLILHIDKDSWNYVFLTYNKLKKKTHEKMLDITHWGNKMAEK